MSSSNCKSIADLEMSAKPKLVKDEKAGYINETIQKAGHAAEEALDVERLKKRAMHTIEEGMTDAKRLVKKGRYAAEDLVDETEHYIKHDPWRSVGITFGVGVVLGVLIGWLLKTNPERPEPNT